MIPNLYYLHYFAWIKAYRFFLIAMTANIEENWRKTVSHKKQNVINFNQLQWIFLLHYRNVGFGVNVFWSRVGAMIAPQIFFLVSWIIYRFSLIWPWVNSLELASKLANIILLLLITYVFCLISLHKNCRNLVLSKEKWRSIRNL